MLNWHPGWQVGVAREIGYREAMHNAGIDVQPDWIAYTPLTGYDDDPTSEFLGITSLRQPIDAVAAIVVDIVLGEISSEPRTERQVVYEPALVVRHSTLM
jgi:DNA-binding LacI/PurR family transcriptional regulator